MNIAKLYICSSNPLLFLWYYSLLNKINCFKCKHRLVSLCVFCMLDGCYIAYVITQTLSGSLRTQRVRGVCFSTVSVTFISMCHVMSAGSTRSFLGQKLNYLLELPTSQFNKYYLLFSNYNSMFVRVNIKKGNVEPLPLFLAILKMLKNGLSFLLKPRPSTLLLHNFTEAQLKSHWTNLKSIFRRF